MDSYTDVSGQCCGRGHMSCNASVPKSCGSYTQPDYPDMTTFPWSSWDTGSAPSCAYAGGYYPAMEQVSCPSMETGCLEQQYSVGMAYVPWQQWQTTYAPERGLMQGTIFPDLDLQFNYGRCGR